MKDTCVVIDIDGVILKSGFIINEIFEKGLKGNKKWDYFYKHCNSDKVTVTKGMPEIILGLAAHGCSLILSTARNEHNRVPTTEKLHKEGIVFKEMYMRQDGDYRPSAEVKRDHLIEISKKYNIKFFMDDDIGNINMAKEMGIGTIQVPSERMNNKNENSSN